MKLLVALLITVFVTVLPYGPSFAQTGTGKSGGDQQAGIGLGGGKGTEPGPGPGLSEQVAVGSDADQAVEELGSPVDPSGDPAGYLDTLITWWKAGWSLAFAFALAYGLVVFAAKYLPWIAATPKRALLISAVTAFLGDIVVRASTGTPITAAIVVASLGVGLATWINGGKAADRAAATKTS